MSDGLFLDTLSAEQEKALSDFCSALGYAKIVVIGYNMDLSRSQYMFRNLNALEAIGLMDVERSRIVSKITAPAPVLRGLPGGKDGA